MNEGKQSEDGDNRSSESSKGLGEDKDGGLFVRPEGEPPCPALAFGEPTNWADDLAGTDYVMATSVPLPIVVKVIETRIKKSILYTDLIIYIPFVVMFTIFVYGGRHIEESYYTSGVLRDRVMGNELSDFEYTKTYVDITSVPDWNNWFSSVLVPNVFHPCGGDANKSVGTRTMQGTNYLLGALRLRTIRASNESCSLEPNLFNETLMEPCYGLAGNGEETDTRFGIQNPLQPASADANRKETTLYTHYQCDEVEGGQYTTGQIAWYHCGGYVIDIPFEKTCGEVQDLVNVLVKYPFIDSVQTRFVSVEFFTYSPAINSFTSVKLFVEFSPSGALLPQYQFRTFLLWTQSRSQGQTIFDFFFFVYILYYIYAFSRDWIVFKRTKGKIVAFLFDVWNALEFVNLIVFLVVFAVRWAWWDISKQSENNSFPYPPTYPKDLDFLLTLWSLQIYANAGNVTLVFLKILKFLRLNPRLGVLTLSIAERKSQLVGVLALFAWSVLAFALAGTSLFGTTMWEFHSIDTSYTTLLRMLVGDFGRLQDGDSGIYPAMRRENRVLAGAFFWGYVVLVFFILLNMTIAILAEGFAVVSAKYSAIPLSEELQQWIASMIRCFRPERIYATLALLKKGISITDCLQRTLYNIEEHNILLKGEDQDLQDSDVTLTRDTFKMYMSISEYKTLGAVYVNDLWYDIVQEYKESLQTDEVLDEMALSNVVYTGTSQVIDPVFKCIKYLNHDSTEFEQSMRCLIKRLRKNLKGKQPVFSTGDKKEDGGEKM